MELEGVSYTDFVVPECPQCMLEGERNSLVRGNVISMSSWVPDMSSTNQSSYSLVNRYRVRLRTARKLVFLCSRFE